MIPILQIAPSLFCTETGDGTMLIFNPLTMASIEIEPEDYTAVHRALVEGDYSVKPDDDVAEQMNLAGMLSYDVQKAWGFEAKAVIHSIGETAPQPFHEEQVTNLVLNITAICNMGCTYCHSNVDGRNQKMPTYILDAALRLVENTARKTGKPVDITLLGEGENLTATDLMRRVVEKVVDMRHEGLTVRLKMTTNATLLTDENVAWIAAAFNHITVSWDGDREATDAQRIFKGGQSTYDAVLRGCEVLRRHDVRFGLRMTATSQSISRLPEFVEIAARDIFAGRWGSITVDPQTAMGKGDALMQPDVEEFNRKFWEARELGKTLKVDVNTKYVEPQPRMHYCGAPGPMFVVAPDGNLTACSRVHKPGDPTFDYFNLGGFDPINQVFTFKEDRITAMRSLTPDTFEDCKTCFLKHHCTGGCYALREEGKIQFSCDLSRVMGREFFIRRHRLVLAALKAKAEKFFCGKW